MSIKIDKFDSNARSHS